MRFREGIGNLNSFMGLWWVEEGWVSLRVFVELKNS